MKKLIELKANVLELIRKYSFPANTLRKSSVILRLHFGNLRRLLSANAANFSNILAMVVKYFQGNSSPWSFCNLS